MFGKANENESLDPQLRGFIGKGVSLTGKMSFEGELRIDGKFSGEIDGTGTLIIGEDAMVEAKIRVDTTLISGEVHGEIEATKKVEIMAPGRMYGDIKTPSLIIADGSIFEGNCVMGGKMGAVVTHLHTNREIEAN